MHTLSNNVVRFFGALMLTQENEVIEPSRLHACSYSRPSRLGDPAKQAVDFEAGKKKEATTITVLGRLVCTEI